MYFITSFLRTYKQHDSIMVILDRLTKVAHFIPVKSTYSISDVEQVFIREIYLRMHGVLKKIMLDKDVKLTSSFCKELFAGLGIKLAFTNTCHS